MPEAAASPRVGVERARQFAEAALQAQGLEQAAAQAVAQRLIEGELLGHRTHGLAQLPVYLERIAEGLIARSGEIRVVSDRGSTFAWEARQLAGAWVMNRALDQAFARSGEYPVVTFTIADCSHIGALQPYVRDAAERGLLALTAVTSPAIRSVAPFGGVTPVLTSNPIAAGIPSHGDPILVDQSTSLTSNSTVAGYERAGQRLPGPWLLDAQGNTSDDPAVLKTDPPGTILPLGGADLGYKGFGLGLIVEALSLALPGYGRHSSVPRVRGGQGVFFQLIDPDALGGREQFLDEISALIESCRNSPAAKGFDKVRLPGDRALVLWREQQRAGLLLDPALAQRLAVWAERLGIDPLRVDS